MLKIDDLLVRRNLFKLFCFTLYIAQILRDRTVQVFAVFVSLNINYQMNFHHILHLSVQLYNYLIYQSFIFVGFIWIELIRGVKIIFANFFVLV